MNARGRPLSTFENFKAWLIGYLYENDIEPDDHEWTLKFDKDWTDLFWRNKEDNRIDVRFTRFINGMVMFGLAEKGDLENVQYFDREEEILHSTYESLRCFEKKQFDRITAVLDWFALNDKNIERELAGLDFWWDGTIFGNFTGTGRTFSSRALFFAITVFVKEAGKRPEFPWKDFRRWLRVTRNLIENTTIVAENLGNALRVLSNLQPFCTNILDHLADEQSALPFFQPRQVSEEKIKARVILSAPEWETEFETAENHSLFRGSIRFIIAVNAPGELAEFLHRRQMAFSMFERDGSLPVYKEKYHLMRAIVALTEVNNDQIALKDNAAGWRTLLRAENIRRGIDLLFKKMADHTETDYKRIMSEIIEEYADKAALWQYYVVKNSCLLTGEASNSNILKWSWDDSFWLFNNTGGNWINNHYQILLSNYRNEIISELIASDPRITPVQRDDWWIIKDPLTKQHFFRGRHIWLFQNVNITDSGVKFTIRYHFMANSVIVGIHKDPDAALQIPANQLGEFDNWKIGKYITFDKIIDETQIAYIVLEIRNYDTHIKNLFGYRG